MKAAELREIDFKESLQVVYEDLEPHLLKELNTLRDKLIELPENANQGLILSLFEECVIALNEIDANEEIESTIDTEEREGLCDALYKMGDLVGLDSDTEYIDDWREW